MLILLCCCCSSNDEEGAAVSSGSIVPTATVGGRSTVSCVCVCGRSEGDGGTLGAREDARLLTDGRDAPIALATVVAAVIDGRRLPARLPLTAAAEEEEECSRDSHGCSFGDAADADRGLLSSVAAFITVDAPSSDCSSDSGGGTLLLLLLLLSMRESDAVARDGADCNDGVVDEDIGDSAAGAAYCC